MMQSLEDIVALFRPKDHLAVALATGQPMALLNALGERTDWQRLDLFCGLVPFPYPLLQNPNVHVISGYYGPIERYLNDSGANISYLPANFTGFEIYAQKTKPRVIATTVSPPDKDGFVTFGTHAGAVDKPFREAYRDKNRVAIAEINPQMPIVYGLAEYGDNKIHIDEIDHVFTAETTPPELPPLDVSAVEKKIAENVLSLIQNGDTLQFGIGGVPDERRAEKLIAIAHPDFRAELKEAFEKIKTEFYKN